MKRSIFLAMLLSAAVLIGFAAPASADVEFKASGHMHLNFSVLDNTRDIGFNKNEPEDNFFAAQRFRPKLTIKAEGVTAVFEVQQHQAIWGSDWPVGGNPDVSGGESGAVRIRQAYVQFKLPATPLELKVGYQHLALPSIWGHPVLDDRVGAVVASLPFGDKIALSLFWARPADKKFALGDNGIDDINLPYAPQHNSDDFFGVLLPLDFGSVKAAPYIVYGKFGLGPIIDDGLATVRVDSLNTRLLIGGINLEVTPTDALSLKLDGIVTNHSSDKRDLELGTGFMLAAAVDYALPWGTPGAFAWYTSGADKNNEGVLFSLATEGFGPSSWGFAGGNTFDYDSQISGIGIGTWAVGVQLADFSCVDGLMHTARLLYVGGTHDKNASLWNENDSFIEANLDSTWSIYENLAAVVELGAIFPNLSSQTKALGFGEDPALKAQLTLRFSF